MSPKYDYEEGEDDNKYSKVEINVGEYVAKRIRVFTKHTNLDPVRQVQTLDWSDVSADRPLLGKGAFSNVYRVHITRSLITTPEGQSGEDNKKEDDDGNHHHHLPIEYYALKRLNATTSQRDKKFKVGASDLALEAKLLERFDHPNIIKLHAVKSGNLEDCINNRDYFLVMDYLVQTLDNRIELWQKEPCLWRKPLLKSIAIKRLIHRIEQTAMGLAQGMEYLHSKNIIFRDLKPENVGYDANGTIKIFDFGLARDLECVRRCGEVMGFTGTPRYMANEIGEGKSYGLKVDVYSFGILLWQICSLKEPFEEMFHIKQYYQWVVTEKRRPDLKYVKFPDLGDLIAKCWHPSPDSRPSFSSLRVQLQQILSDESSSRMCNNSSSSSRRSSCGGNNTSSRPLSRSKSLLVNMGELIQSTEAFNVLDTSRHGSVTTPWEQDSGAFTEEMASSRGSSTKLSRTRTRDVSR